MSRIMRKCTTIPLSILILLAAYVAAQAGSTPTLNTTPTAEATPWPTRTPLPSVPLKPGEKLKALATTNIVADVVKNVGGEAIDLKTLLPLGSDPHSFEPTPRDLTAASDAHVIFANGAGLEEFLEKMLKSAAGNVPVIYVSDGVPLRRLASEIPGTTPEPAAVGFDPHTWFSPAAVVVWVHNIRDALSALDPAHTADYEANAAKYEAALNDLDAWIKEQVGQIPPDKRKLVTDHFTFGYFADRYGFEMVGAVIPSFSSVAQPSAQELAHLEDTIRQTGVKAIFVSNVINDSLSRRIAGDTGIQVIKLFDGSLGPPGSGAETYLDFMRYNVQAIVNALK